MDSYEPEEICAPAVAASSTDLPARDIETPAAEWVWRVVQLPGSGRPFAGSVADTPLNAGEGRARSAAQGN